MKKFLVILVSIFFIFLMIICVKDEFLFNKEKNETEKTKETLIYESINSYYSKERPKNKGDLKIYTIKDLDDDFLVLCEKNSNDGQRYSDLFILNSNYEIIGLTTGEIPISMCFSANKVTYKDRIILFGNFTNTKWDKVNDIKVPVNIDTIEIKLDNKILLTEKVSIDTGYIIPVNADSIILDISLYNDGYELESNLNDIGSISEKTLKLINSTNN